MIEYISPSTLDLLMSCPRKFQLRKGERLTTEGESTALSFGSAWHSIQHNLRMGMNPQAAWQEATKDYIDPPKDHRTAERLNQAMWHYLDHYGGYIKPYGPITSEQETVISIPGVRMPVKLIIDVVAEVDVNEMRGKELWVVDHKTTSRLDSSWPQQYRVSNQFKCYYEAARQEFPEVAGVLVDVFNITKGVSTDRGKAGKTPSEIDGCHFHRLAIRYEDVAIEEWKRTVDLELRKLQMYQDEGFFPMNAPTACSAFHSRCEFLDICEIQNPNLREQIKKSYYKETEDGEESSDS